MLGRVLDHNDGHPLASRDHHVHAHLSEQIRTTSKYTVYSTNEVHRGTVADGLCPQLPSFVWKHRPPHLGHVGYNTKFGQMLVKG